MQAEQVAQVNIMNWLQYNYPDEYKDTLHIANERRCSIQQGVLLKKLGVKRGVSDMFMAVPRGGYSGLWIELKVGKGKPSKEQQEFLARMTLRGYMAACVWGYEGATEVIASYLETR